MSKPYLFFDLDHTLWDFETNSKETLIELFQKYNLKQFSLFDFDLFEKTYSLINRQLWEEYNHGKINKQALRAARFALTFDKLGLDGQYHPKNIANDYLNICPQKSHLMPGTKDMLQSLAGNYQMSILTNGFAESQHKKLKASGINHYFEHIIISEEIGAAKPYPEFFELALKRCNAKPQNSIMVGDNEQTDVKGALQSGLTAVWYNPDHQKAQLVPHHTISHHQQFIPQLGL